MKETDRDTQTERFRNKEGERQNLCSGVIVISNTGQGPTGMQDCKMLLLSGRYLVYVAQRLCLVCLLCLCAWSAWCAWFASHTNHCPACHWSTSTPIHNPVCVFMWSTRVCLRV